MPDTLESIVTEHSHRLIRLARSGDEQAFGKLVKLWSKRVYNIAFNYFGEHDHAMEASQKTFITVYEKLDGLKKIESFQHWIYTIAINHCRGVHRSNKGVSSLSEYLEHGSTKDIQDENGDPETILLELEGTALIRSLLMRLPEDQRMVIIMKEYEGLKFREIASLLSISENTVKSRLYYGLTRLKSIIEKNNLKSKLLY